MRPAEHLFLSGNQRSGKTLLQLMLCSHPEITISPGTNALGWLLYSVPQRRPVDRRELLRRLEKDAKWNAWRIDHAAYRARVERWGDRLPAEAAADLMAYFRDHTKPGARYSGNKKGIHCKEGDVLLQRFPSSKLVFLIRDGRGAVASMIETQDHDVYSASRMWTLKARRIRELAAQFPRDVFVVRYEALCVDPERMCRDLCTFLRLDYDPAMLTDYRTNDAIRHTTDTTHPETYQAITTSMIDEWKTHLGPEQIDVVEGIGGRELEAHGYRRSRNKSSVPRRARYRLLRTRDYADWWIEHQRRRYR